MLGKHHPYSGLWEWGDGLDRALQYLFYLFNLFIYFIFHSLSSVILAHLLSTSHLLPSFIWIPTQHQSPQHQDTPTLYYKHVFIFSRKSWPLFKKYQVWWKWRGSSEVCSKRYSPDCRIKIGRWWKKSLVGEGRYEIEVRNLILYVDSIKR